MIFSNIKEMTGIIEFSDTIVKSRRLNIILWIILSFLLVTSFLLMGFSGFSGLLVDILAVSLMGLLILSILSLKFYNWPVILFMFVFIGIYFKREHWPYAASLMTLGTVFLGSVCWFNSFKFFYTFRNNIFLKWFGFLSGIIVILFMMGFLFMNMHWSGTIRDILIRSGCFLFVFSVLALVFTLPFSNYVAWSDIERKVLFRTILTPMLFILALFTLVFVFPDTYNSLTGRGSITPPWSPWYILNIELYNLEGIPAL
jgi:hypothetical protein